MNEPLSETSSSTRRSRMVAAILATAVVAGGLTFFSAHTADKPETAQAPPPATAMVANVAPAAEVRWPVALQAMGPIAPWQEASIGAQVTGLRLAEIKVDVGDRVRRGQLLARFDRAALEIEQTRLQAQWRQAEANRGRALQLEGTGGISEQELLQQVTQADVAKAQLQSVQLQIRQADVVAPDDGVVSARSATLGSVATSGQELFRLIRKDRLEWRGELTAEQLGHVRQGQLVRLALPGSGSATATVRQVAPTLQAQNRLGIVLADIDAGSHARAGMYAQGVLELAESRAVIVPANSIVLRDGRSHVMTLTDDSRVQERRVEVGRRRGVMAEILSGLEAGERVITQGAGFFNEGDSVRAVPAAGESVKGKGRS